MTNAWIGLAEAVPGHEVVHASQLGFSELSNGKLLDAAESNGFHVLITVDKGLRHQQNLVGRKVSAVTLATRLITLESLLPLVPQLIEALRLIGAGEFVTVEAE